MVRCLFTWEHERNSFRESGPNRHWNLKKRISPTEWVKSAYEGTASQKVVRKEWSFYMGINYEWIGFRESGLKRLLVVLHGNIKGFVSRKVVQKDEWSFYTEI